jgi:PAS domain S-box-containing protein
MITNWNGSAERLFGYKAEDAIGKPITILIPEDRLQEEADIIGRIRSGRHVEHFETARRRKNGSPIEISVAISPIKNSAGEVIGASNTARDITGAQAARPTDRRTCPGSGTPVQEPAGDGAGNRPPHSARYADRSEGGHHGSDRGAGPRPRALRRNEVGGSGLAKPGHARASAILPGRLEVRGGRGDERHAATRCGPGYCGLSARTGRPMQRSTAPCRCPAGASMSTGRWRRMDG